VANKVAKAGSKAAGSRSLASSSKSPDARADSKVDSIKVGNRTADQTCVRLDPLRNPRGFLPAPLSLSASLAAT
jgi:hypothetical protein